MGLPLPEPPFWKLGDYIPVTLYEDRSWYNIKCSVSFCDTAPEPVVEVSLILMESF